MSSTSAAQKLVNSVLLLVSAQLIGAPMANAAASYLGSADSRAETAAQERLLNTDLKTIATPIADASKCGIKGPATLVEVQIARVSQTTAADGTSSTTRSFETVKSYLVSPGYFSRVVDADACKN